MVHMFWGGIAGWFDIAGVAMVINMPFIKYSEYYSEYRFQSSLQTGSSAGRLKNTKLPPRSPNQWLGEARVGSMYSRAMY